MRAVVTGAAGRLGRCLLELNWEDHQPIGVTRADADLSDAKATMKLLSRLKPDVVVHTAAATDLVKCEQDRQYAWTNVALPAIHVGAACSALRSRLVHVSTDYVFSGHEPIHPIPAWMRPDPVNYYAICKVAAEAAAMTVPDHLVIRATMKERAPWPHAQAPTDMWISHSYYDEVAGFLRDRVLDGSEGILHFGVRDVNVFDFASQSREDVKPVLRNDIRSLPLPGDIRLEVRHAE